MNTDSNPRNNSTARQRRLVGFVWPTGRAVYTYTADEIAAGVDVYTQSLKRRHTRQAGEHDAA